MENTVVGVYDSYAQAQNAMNELLACGFSRDALNISSDTDSIGTTRASTEGTQESGIGHFFRSLFGMEDEHREHRDVYSEAVRRGSVVLTVDTNSDEESERATEVMNRFSPVDIDERSAHWRTQGWSGYDESAPRYTDSEIEKDRSLYAQGMSTTDTTGTTGIAGTTDSTAQRAGTQETQRIPVVEEELRVGKREVQRGGVRVYQRVKETPVHESVNLREEHVTVDRQPVDKPATEADMAAFKEGAVELREMAEEPVVEKTARVVEEVVVGKDVTQETRDIKDTVRRTDVEVEQLGKGAGSTATTGTTMTGTTAAARNTDFADTSATSDDADFRTHWQNAYGTSGGRYEDYDAAYRYGSTMAGSGRYQNYNWDTAESDMRRDWEAQHPESAWDKVKDAVRYGAEKVTGRSQRH